MEGSQAGYSPLISHIPLLFITFCKPTQENVIADYKTSVLGNAGFLNQTVLVSFRLS